MTKAIVWSLIGLLLGVALGARMGAVQAAVLGTLIGAVAGGPPILAAARACRSPCRGCKAVCEIPKKGVSLKGSLLAAGAVVASVIAADVAGVAAPFLLPVAFASAALVVAVRQALLRMSPTLQRTGRLGLGNEAAIEMVARQTLAMQRREAQLKLEAARRKALKRQRRRAVRPALTRGPLAIEAPQPVVEGVIISERTTAPGGGRMTG